MCEKTCPVMKRLKELAQLRAEKARWFGPGTRTLKDVELRAEREFENLLDDLATLLTKTEDLVTLIPSRDGY